MILINLLPHRALARMRARRAFNRSLIASVMLGVLVVLGIHVWSQRLVDAQLGRNRLLASAIQALDIDIRDATTLQAEINALKARQQAVEDLQVNRNLPVHLLNEAVRQLPDGVFLKSIQQDQQSVLLGGVAQSNERVSELMRNLSRHSEWVSSPELIESVASSLALNPREQRRVYHFTLRAQLQRAGDAPTVKTAQAPAAAPHRQ